jgi:DNA-binding transcriptional ArsR family regulator
MTTGRPVGYSAISSYSRVEILHLVQEQPRRTITEIVEATGLHPNTVREHLQRLIDEGYVVSAAEHRTTRGRPRVLYSAADGILASSPIQRRKVRAAAERGDLMRRVLPGPPRAGHRSPPPGRRPRRGPDRRRLRSPRR